MSEEISSHGNDKNLDGILLKYKLFGHFHVKALVWLFLANASNTVYCANFIFTVEEVGYRCKDNAFQNNTCSSLQDSTQRCSEWIYDNPNSFVGEFQLACQDWKRTLVGTVHSFGYMVGLLFVGPMSDRWGRKLLIVITGVLGGVMGVSRSFTTSYWIFIALEFLEAAIGDLCSPVYMLGIEIVASKKRLLYQMLCSYGFTLGSALLPLMAYLFPYYRTLLQVMYTPALLFFLYIFLLDESPRWLLSKGRKEEAVYILQKAADMNKIKLDKNMLDELSYEESKGVNYRDLLKYTFASRALLKRFFICLTWWTVSTFVNYGMTINSVSLQGNKYINYALMSLVDIPGCIVITYAMIRFKRKLPLILSFFGAAILCFIQPFVPTDMPWLSVLLFMASKFMSSAYFNITYIFTSELFPTYTRNSMHALCSSLGRIGSTIAPQTPLLMHYWPGLPSLVFGCASLIGGLVTFFVPDTADDSLPDTVRQAEALGIKQAPNENVKEEQGFVNEKHSSRL